MAALDEEMNTLNEIGKVLGDVRPGDIIATATLSPEARGVYHHLLSEMEKGNKDVQKSARAAALLAARMTDRLVALHREAGDKDYTAMDALPELLANAGETAQEKEAAQLRQTVADRRLKEDVLAWKEKVNRFLEGTLPLRNNIVMRSPLVFDLIGADNLPIVIDSRILQKIVNKHKFTRKELIQLPQKIANPLFILRAIDSKTGEEDKQKKIVVIDMEVNGATVMVPFVLNTTQGFNKIASAYGRTKRQVPNDDWYVQRLNNKNLLYINKKMTDRWVKSRTGLAGRHNAPLTIQSFAVNNIPNETDLGKLKRENRGYYQRAQVRTQKEAVRKQYEGTAMWMKAPNGKDTNLTEEQWLLVRTPAFKAWFGDWEAEAEKQKYLNTTPIKVMENQIVEKGDISAKEAAFQWAEDNLPVQIVTRFGNVEINRTSIKDSLGHGFSQKKLDAITSLPEGMKIAAFIGEEPDFNGAPLDNGYFCYPILYQGETQVVFCRARRDINSNKVYVYEVWMEDEIKDIPLQTAAKFLNSKPHGGNVLYKSILANFLNNSNTASKVVDENGEPLVVYHGSDAEFDVFDSSKGRSGMNIQGMFFSPWEIDAQGYGGNVRAFFLNIKKPANEGQGYKALNRYAGQNYAGTKAREDLITNGYDGVNNDGEEFIAFEPTQIKSVDNNGNFDPEDANIYHQEAGRETAEERAKRISQEVFQTYLNDGIMKAVEKTVAAEIGQYTNLDAMDDPVAKDKARDELPYIKALLVQFNSRTIQKNVDYKDRYAAKIEYARRCFDNDERIKAGATRRMVGNEGQGDLHQNRNGTGSAEYKRGNGAAVQRLHGRVSAGISNQVSGEKRGAREHFEKLYNETAKKHSENQGAFSHGLLEQSAWHGSPYRFPAFDLGAIGSGAGAQAHGWGLYFAKNQETAKVYKNDNGGLYEADIPDDDVLLGEQKTFREQPSKVKKGLWELIDHLTMEQLENWDDVLRLGKAKVVAKIKQALSESDGGNIYGTLVDLVAGDKEASLLLNKYGIKGISYDDRNTGPCYVIFDDKTVSILNRYEQAIKQEIKGNYDQAQAIIRLFEGADPSTFMHEMSHHYLSEMAKLANMFPESEAAKDYETIMQWASWQEGQVKAYAGTASAKEFQARDEAIRKAEKAGDAFEVKRLKDVWGQERFARAFEEYLHSGDAPTSVLKQIFRRFKRWLSDIYKTVTGAGVRATSEVEAVMARIVATDAEIEAAALLKRANRIAEVAPDLLNTDTAEMVARWEREAFINIHQ